MKMLGRKVHGPVCQWGCCISDWVGTSREAKRFRTRLNKRREAREWKKDLEK